jgi:HlyD family secretion protein
MTRSRLMVVAAAVATVAVVAWWLVHTGRLGGGGSPRDTLTLYGNVDIRQVELGFRVAGRLKAMLFEEGQAVTAGTLLAELDPVTFEHDLQAAVANLDVQEATLRKLVKGSRPEEILRGKAAVEEATASAKNARLDLARAERLLADGATPRSTYDNALAASLQADARLASANESYRLLVEGNRQEDIAAGRAAMLAAQARVATSRTALEDTHLLAPSDGVILSRVREPGAIVSPNDIVYVLSLTSSVWVRAYVAEPQLGRLHPGMSVTVSYDAAPSRRVKGHIGFISPTAEFTPKSVETPELRTDLVYRLRLIVDEPDPGLRQGMPVTVRIPVGAPGA